MSENTETYAIVMLDKLPYALFEDFETAKQYVDDHDRLDSENASVFWPVSPMSETEVNPDQ